MALLAAVLVGSTALAPADLFAALGRLVRGADRLAADTIVFGIRLPRALLAAAVGASLGLA